MISFLCHGVRKKPLRPLLWLLAYCLLAWTTPASAADGWTDVASLKTGRSEHTATLLANGKVLVVGGYNGKELASAEIYDPATDTWTESAPMANARRAHSAILLPNGKVLVLHGYRYDLIDSPYGPQPKQVTVADAELYDPLTNSWSPAGVATADVNRFYPIYAVLLKSGKVLTVMAAKSALYDYATNSWSDAAPPEWPSQDAKATLLDDGKVLVVASGRSQLYDPVWNRWTLFEKGSGTLDVGDFSVTLLTDGKVLVAGGENLISTTGGPFSHSSAKTYDPRANLWKPVSSMASRRSQHSATSLPNGQVLVVGGVDRWGDIASTELYDPATDKWSIVSPLATRRWDHTATLLPSGNVLVLGGNTGGCGEGHSASAHMYGPVRNAWSAPAGRLALPRSRHTATLLSDGTVLVAGGGDWTTTISASELFNPATGEWEPTGGLNVGRVGHTATRLADGRVLVSGGSGISHLPPPISSTELYDPVTRTWTSGPPLLTARSNHTAALLSNGKILIGGGGLTSTELYDPVTNTWAQGPELPAWVGTLDIGGVRALSMVGVAGGKLLILGDRGTIGDRPTGFAQYYDPATNAVSEPVTFPSLPPKFAARLPNDRVVIAGEAWRYSDWTQPYLVSVGVFDSNQQTLLAGPNWLTTRRTGVTSALLPNGKLLATGGACGIFMGSAELYDPATQTSKILNMSTARTEHTATVLANGAVLIAGGWNGTTVADAELLYPVATAAPFTGLWWNPDESGWGMSVEQQGPIMFVGWYTYDAAGNSTRYFMPDCTVLGNGCGGPIYRVSGGAMPTASWTGHGPVTEVGSGRLKFSDNNAGVFEFTLNGLTGSKNIVRNVFGDAIVAPAIDHTGLWWNPAEPGWGVFLSHQSANIFAAVYSYDAQGNPVRYVASNCAVSGNGCSGTLYKTSGGTQPTVPWAGPVTLTPIGTIDLSFGEGGSATMNITIDGKTASKPLSRMVFYAPPG